MYESLKKLYLELSKQEKRKLFLLGIVVVISSIVQVVGVASIFPFIAVATNPEVIDSNAYLSWFKLLLNINDNRDFLMILGGGVLAMLILTNAFLAFSTWLTVSFIETMLNTMAYRMLQRYLTESYLFHLQRNSAELMKNLTIEVTRVVNGGFMSAITIVSKGFGALCILCFLVILDPYIAAIMGGVLGGAYVMIYFTIRKKIARVGREATQLFSERYRYISESLGGIKDLMVLGRERLFLDRFSEVSEKVIKCQVYKRSVTELPRFLLETISFGGILAITIYFVAVKDDTQTILPMIALYGLAGYRLMPALQAVFQSTANLKHDIAAVDLFYDDLKGLSNQTLHSVVGVSPAAQKNKTLLLEKEIELRNICFRYPNVTNDAISQLSLKIKANTSIGIVGSSGSGKSTLVDIILGLLNPRGGEIVIDGKPLTPENLRAWQNNIGYVPQMIFLADSSVSENIAFGIASDEIDQTAVENAAKLYAGSSDFAKTAQIQRFCNY